MRRISYMTAFLFAFASCSGPQPKEEKSAKTMVNYFTPLMDYLKAENKGHTHTLPGHI